MKPKKRKQRGQRKRSNATYPAKFDLWNRVRVKPGTTVPDFEDIPLGGWVGTISEVDRQSNPPMYLIEWDQHTLDHMHPVYRHRCERDDLMLESMWLPETDVELDSGEPVVIEQPTHIVARPLSKGDPEDRIREIFALTSDDPLPPVNRENLHRYTRYLTTHLSFPFPARYIVVTPPFKLRAFAVTVVGLLDADDCDEKEGVLCKVGPHGKPDVLPLASLEVSHNRQQRKLIEDYSRWFYEGSGDDRTPISPTSTPPQRESLTKMILKCVRGTAMCGTVLGSLLATSENAWIGALVGAAILGVLGWLMGRKNGPIRDEENRINGLAIIARILSVAGGCLFGSLLGAILVAFVWTLSGGIVGWLIWWLLGKVRRKAVKPIWGIFLGVGGGAILSAWYSDAEKAMTGALIGLGIGVVLGPVLFLAMIGIVALLFTSDKDLDGDKLPIHTS